MVYQRLQNDCGVAALATVLGVQYEDVAAVWEPVLKKPVGLSYGSDLIRVADALGSSLSRVWWNRVHSPRIVRTREYRGAWDSHWVCMFSDGLWCPALGWYSDITEYPWRAYSQALVLAQR